MNIFLRRIPAGTKISEIVDFIEPALAGGLLSKSGHIDHVKIIVLKDTSTNIKEYHGLVAVDTDAVGKRIIKKLNRQVFKGKHIVVREYHDRSWHNDPRINRNEWNEELASKRNSDRRRSNIEKEKDISA